MGRDRGARVTGVRGGSGSPAEVRPASRVLLFDVDERLLLFKAAPFAEGGGFWFAPGGGLEAGETHVRAAIRELREETAIDVVADDLRGPVWRRRHVFAYNGRRFDQRELYFVCRLTRAVGVDMSGDVYGDEHADHRWWSLDEIHASDADFAPRGLGDLLPPVLAGRIGGGPIDISP